jgi:hypothetical protein
LHFLVTSKLTQSVTPAEAGVQEAAQILDSGFRRNDAEAVLKLPQNTKEFFKFFVPFVEKNNVGLRESYPDRPLCLP